MAEELQENLATYNLQLQQVEASLTNDPGNEDLIKLKKDLQEVINLTLELLSQNTKAKKLTETPQTEPSSDRAYAPGHGALTPAEGPAHIPEAQATPTHDWKVGDECLAVWSTDGGLYPAVVEEILENGSCTVTFQGYGNTDLTQVHLLRKMEEKSEGTDGAAPKSKKDLVAQHREYKRKKQQKKAQRQKQQEEEREMEKNKWQNFNTKTLTKMSKGKVKKSIFATTDTVQGRVGVGTCGTSGRPMTNYHQQEKWRKS